MKTLLVALLLLMPTAALADSRVSAVAVFDPGTAMGANTPALGIGIAPVVYHQFSLNVDVTGQDVTENVYAGCPPVTMLCHTQSRTEFAVLPYIGLSAHVTRNLSLGIDSSFVSGQFGKPALSLRIDL